MRRRVQRRRRAGVPPVRGGRRPLGHGHGRAGRRPVGERPRRADADEWLRRGEQHLELVGATQDVRSHPGAARRAARARPVTTRPRQRLREAPTSPQVDGDGRRAGPPRAGPGRLADRAGTTRRSATPTRSAAHRRGSRDRRCRRRGSCSGSRRPCVHLRVAARPDRRRGGRRPDARAVDAARGRRGAEAVSVMDMPVLGSCALGGAELAAHRGRRRPRPRAVGARHAARRQPACILFQPGLRSSASRPPSAPSDDRESPGSRSGGEPAGGRGRRGRAIARS